MAAPSYRTPLLWILLPSIAGYTLGHHLPGITPLIPLTVGIAALGGAAWSLRLRGKSAQIPIWPIAFTMGMLSVSLAYFQKVHHTPEAWTQLPQREADLALKVKRLYDGGGPELARGIAEITGAQPHLTDLVGRKVYFSTRHEGQFIYRGSRLKARGVLRYLPSGEISSSFEKGLLNQNIPLIFRRASLLEPPGDGTVKEILTARLRARCLHLLGRGIENYPESIAVFRAMMLGMKGELKTEDKQLFLKTGTLHLFAISGLHVGIVALSLAGILNLLRVPAKVSVVVGLALVYVYVEITGANPSAVRAFAMTAFFWAGNSMARQMPPFQALTASAVIVLLLQPSQLFSPGFQLSYSVVSGILLWGMPLNRMARDRLYAAQPQKSRFQSKVQTRLLKFLEAILGALIIGVAAFLASTPLSILYFGIFPPPAILLNLLLVPAATLVIFSGMLSLIFGLAGMEVLSIFFNHGPLTLIRLTEKMLESMVSIPGLFYDMRWIHEPLAFLTLFIYLGSILCAHALRLSKPKLFAIPVVFLAIMLCLNALGVQLLSSSS